MYQDSMYVYHITLSSPFENFDWNRISYNNDYGPKAYFSFTRQGIISFARNRNMDNGNVLRIAIPINLYYNTNSFYTIGNGLNVANFNYPGEDSTGHDWGVMSVNDYFNCLSTIFYWRINDKSLPYVDADIMIGPRADSTFPDDLYDAYHMFINLSEYPTIEDYYMIADRIKLEHLDPQIALNEYAMNSLGYSYLDFEKNWCSYYDFVQNPDW